MAEYIEKQAAIDALHEAYEARNPTQNAIMDKATMVIFRLPPADVRPVRRGRWIPDRTDKWVCSECQVGNNYAYSWDSITKDYTHLQDFYCPNCGADMRGGDADGGKH